MTRPAIFLDRDGVLVEDCCLLTHLDQLRILDGVPAALARFQAAGFQLIVITNQSVVARGLISEDELAEIHAEMCRQLAAAGAPPLDAIYACTHHPEAALEAYRIECDCRKPRSGALLRAAREHDLDLAASYLVGDRITDIAAGAGAGCRTVLVRSTASDDPPLMTLEPLDESLAPDHRCADLQAAADWILARR
jgi:D-glycero-D-manno-heptose 1,7-bisphosphate phosphatase